MVGPAPKKRGTLYLLILNWVTGATEPNAKVITQMPGGGGGGGKGDTTWGLLWRWGGWKDYRKIENGNHKENTYCLLGGCQSMGGCKRKGRRGGITN